MNTAVHLLQDIRRACRAAGRLGRDELIGIAVARGCRHYAAFVPPELVNDRPDIPHEVLGCALLAGPQDVETFRAIRVGAMILSDAGNSAHTMADAADAFGVTARLLHIARVGAEADNRPDFWRDVLAHLPATDSASEARFLPNASRFSVENRLNGHGRGADRVWLHTNYRR
ncbi:MAG: hypothetical protein ABSE59_11715 [Opitutaceae bacterium]|jgi:hypothetical protein